MARIRLSAKRDKVEDACVGCGNPYLVTTFTNGTGWGPCCRDLFVAAIAVWNGRQALAAGTLNF